MRELSTYEFLTSEATELATNCWLDSYYKDMRSRIEPDAQMATLLLKHSKQCRRRAYRHARRALKWHQLAESK